MSHDEKKERQPGAVDSTARGNIIHVNFCGSKRRLPPRFPPQGPGIVARLNRRTSTLALSAPWVIRILALLGILALSLLVL